MTGTARRRWKIVCATLAYSSVALWICTLVLVYGAMPRAPDPVAGRVIPWRNHGAFVYLSAQEDFLAKAAMVASVVLFVVAALIDRKFDPWQRRDR